MKWLSENDVAYRLLMEDVNIWILMSGCMDFSGTDFNGFNFLH